MNIQITNVSMRYVDGQIDSVQVHFNGQNDERTINVNGYIPLTAEQYMGNEAPSALIEIVRQEVATKIMDGGRAE
ncbi:hypothetical protein SAMN05421839_10970 [Halolactibacillus halophilus]|uniref:Uncharacterized protein n=1 Tax=Halolactibacillus halophilus TaxID=306540 RepID=A0A1I5NK14_9BACI|nr:hypothetical protein [Halolactibacillus halophilus]GEM01357.1 hypothetical protein HHA03_08890 [Halolactibacillus halophilus]SFP21676.1 hypothetical protein SAMN05421839_10970 [Halolactibacillus halophilus]